MNNTLKKALLIGGSLLAIVIILIAVSSSKTMKSGSTAIPSQQNAESSSISLFASESIATIGTFFQGGHNSDANALATYASVGNCAKSSSTLFAVKNPFSATSTAQLVILTGQNGTTTIDFLVGTSTTATAPLNGNLSSPTLLNMTQVATSTSFITSSGVQVGPSGAWNAPGTTNVFIGVGPSDYLLGQATSSWAASSVIGMQGITNTTSNLSCTYKVLWDK